MRTLSRRRSLTMGVAMALSFLLAGSAVAQSPGPRNGTSRLAGDTRIGTAVAIAQRAFPDGAETVYVANADQPVDAVVGGTLTDGPILLVPTCDLPDVVATELGRIAPDEVIALGGTMAVCDEVLDQAATAAGLDSLSGATGRDDAEYTCASPPFVPAELFTQEVGAETKEGEVYDALRFHLEEGTGFGPYPDGPWYEIQVSEDRAFFLALYDRQSPDGPIGVDMSLELEGGAWNWAGAGECKPYAFAPDLGTATWALADPEPAATDTTFTALVTELACTGGQSSEGRVQSPIIDYGDEEIIVTFFVDPLPPGTYTCPGNPSTSVTVDLDQPLGNRALMDGGTYPSREPTGS